MSTKMKVLVSLSYFLFLLVLAEVASRLLFAIPAFSERVAYQGSLSWRRGWVHGRPKGPLGEVFEMYNPTKGWVLKPNIRNMTVFEKRVLNTNSKGFRGIAEYSPGPHHGKVRVLILGDSFTFGDGVSDSETYPAFLQRMIPTAEIINAGVRGYGHDQMLILLQEEGAKYMPDIVILGFLTEDMERNLLQFRSYAKPMFLLDHDKLVLSGSPVPFPNAIRKWDWAIPRVCDVCEFLLLKWRSYSGLYEKRKRDVTARILDEIARKSEQSGAIPMFVYIPAVDDPTDRTTLTDGEEFLFSFCHAKKTIRCLSARPLFVEKIKNGVKLETGETGHWGPAANSMIAEAIYYFMATNEMGSLQLSPVGGHEKKTM